ncbi:tRNA pseudouridine(55) synthase TruB [Clostridium polynesiense]|uniref:tRNA pseudouridine(55) synthase TruB n=1 Tax=Clostridium polynesiense TaxID=1325933 RepID=UPI00058ECE87|nr:tRNA pseudouridine(55) synthase TruB [Clostridium polynesiense]
MNGIINVNKPEGITSFDVVRTIKRLCEKKEKVGHAGTLDPLATGVLPVCIGKATKIIDYVMNETKIYKAVLKLGVNTDTYDKEGSVVLTRSTEEITKEGLIKSLKAFIGEVSQVPPMYSALKVNGTRLYELARKGIEVERQPRKVHIYSIDILSFNLPYAEILVHCSKGTYIRSLCYDIGEALNCGAAMWELERRKNGIFDINSSIKLEELNSDNITENLVSLEEALIKYPKIYLDDYFQKLFINGVAIQDKRLINTIPDSNQVYAVYSKDDALIGLGKKNNNSFKIEKLLI